MRFTPFVHRPSSINIPATDSLTLNCNATGDPKPSVTWFKNGEPLTKLDNKRVGIVASGYTLKFTRLVPGHNGNYSCNVSNTRGSINHTFNINIKGNKMAKAWSQCMRIHTRKKHNKILYRDNFFLIEKKIWKCGSETLFPSM